jgi:metal-responsive CopG/Arc/MetJ family transcriptional regulator
MGGIIASMSAMAISITLDDQLCRQIDEAVAGGNRSAFIARAIREYLDRRNIAAAAAWHTSLTGEDAAALAAFDAEW